MGGCAGKQAAKQAKQSEAGPTADVNDAAPAAQVAEAPVQETAATTQAPRPDDLSLSQEPGTDPTTSPIEESSDAAALDSALAGIEAVAERAADETKPAVATTADSSVGGADSTGVDEASEAKDVHQAKATASVPAEASSPNASTQEASAEVAAEEPKAETAQTQLEAQVQAEAQSEAQGDNGNNPIIEASTEKAPTTEASAAEAPTGSLAAPTVDTADISVAVDTDGEGSPINAVAQVDTEVNSGQVNAEDKPVDFTGTTINAKIETSQASDIESKVDNGQQNVVTARVATEASAEIAGAEAAQAAKTAQNSSAKSSKPRLQLPVEVCSASSCENKATKMCSQCMKTAYCSKACQLKHWKSGHKQECAK
mmetsp:Transcript_19845/g.35283  ORF Transcript_19845/g.35283 Transcript_19845/m.35283 type:complete len:370 (+) Transcript_19845:449-1558(+)